MDSASIQTPIISLVTENIYHGGKLVIPAGTEVHGTAQTDRHRERIASGNNWTFVWQSGEELRLKGIALDREFPATRKVGASPTAVQGCADDCSSPTTWRRSNCSPRRFVRAASSLTEKGADHLWLD